MRLEPMLLNVILQCYLIKQILERCWGIRCVPLMVVSGGCTPNPRPHRPTCRPTQHTKILAAAPPPMEMSSQASAQSTPATGINSYGDVSLCM